MSQISDLLLNDQELVEEIIKIRVCELALLDLVKSNKISGTVHTCIGQELTPVVLSRHLRQSDMIFSNHRGHGHYLAATKDYYGLIAELVGKNTGCSRGMGGSQHLYNTNFLSNGIQGGMLPIAAGKAYSIKKSASGDIAVVFIGDGTFGEGIVYETLNFCAIWNLPLLVVVENNHVAQSTSTKQVCAGTIKGRAQAFDIKYLNVCGNNPYEMDSVFSDAVNYVRENSKTTILEVDSSRLMAHSKGDDNRDPKIIEHLESVDLINLIKFSQPESYSEIERKYRFEIDHIISEVQSDPEPNISLPSPVLDTTEFGEFEKKDAGVLYNQLIHECLEKLLLEDKRIELLGEDIEGSNEFHPISYGGAFRVTKDLSNKFPGRVNNTPISEAAIVGISTGMSLGGLRPIAEIMFGDFCTLIFDQLQQHAAKFVTMYGYNIEVPLIVRTPMGGGRGYGPTHSQSIEKHFLGIPNLNVVALNHRLHPQKVFETLIRNITSPTLLIENKKVYSQRYLENIINGYDYLISNDRFPVIKIRPRILAKHINLTIACYGGTLIEVEQAALELFTEFEIVCEILVFSEISKVNINPILDSLSHHRNLLIVEDGSNYASWSSEIISQLAEKSIDVDVRRLANNSFIPASSLLEKSVLVNTNTIIEKALELCNDA